MSADLEQSRAGAFCACCAGSGKVSDEYGDGWIETACVCCYGSGLNYPVDELYWPWEILLLRWGWILVVAGVGLLTWLVIA